MTAHTALSTLTASLLMIAVTTLSACGAGDAGSPGNAQSDTQRDAQGAGSRDSSSASPQLKNAGGAVAEGASASFAALPDAASDGAVADVQASLAADNRQVAPVLRYAPGDSSN
ncbi:hypothetical protein [Paraburkholderia sp. GAS334]|uniref:hypothetical protein n=1 Tax=Paraburkholderia sp. GAS334 TaxID=3035131 RepID=UPI003D1EC889